MNRLTDGIKDHQAKKWALYCMMGATVFLTGLMVLAIFWLVRPYDLVRFGEPVSEVLTKEVFQGQTIVVRNPSYCVDDVDTTIERWADQFNSEGERIASFQMYSIELYGKGKGLVCNSPSISNIALPNYVVGLDNKTATFQIRQVISYRPNPVRVVIVDINTTSFDVIPVTQTFKDGKDG